jgi:hypothetical protein
MTALTETWLYDGISNGELFDLSTYNVFRQDRNFTLTGRRRSGGVLLAVRSALNANRCNIFCDSLPNVDLLIIKIDINFRTLYVLLTYHLLTITPCIVFFAIF